jgi:hypothetical protein
MRFLTSLIRITFTFHIYKLYLYFVRLQVLTATSMNIAIFLGSGYSYLVSIKSSRK